MKIVMSTFILYTCLNTLTKRMDCESVFHIDQFDLRNVFLAIESLVQSATVDDHTTECVVLLLLLWWLPSRHIFRLLQTPSSIQARSEESLRYFLLFECIHATIFSGFICCMKLARDRSDFGSKMKPDWFSWMFSTSRYTIFLWKCAYYSSE